MTKFVRCSVALALALAFVQSAFTQQATKLSCRSSMPWLIGTRPAIMTTQERSTLQRTSLSQILRSAMLFGITAAELPGTHVRTIRSPVGIRGGFSIQTPLISRKR